MMCGTGGRERERACLPKDLLSVSSGLLDEESRREKERVNAGERERERHATVKANHMPN